MGNLHPRLRANLKAIQLIAVVKHSFLKEYGLHSVLKPFIDDMNMLSKVYMLLYSHMHTWLIALYVGLYLDINARQGNICKRSCVSSVS